MKKIASLLTLLLLTVSGFTQTTRIFPIKDTIDFNNQFDFDVHFLALEGTYKTRVGQKTMLGFSLGAGALFRGNGNEGFIEVLKAKTLLDYSFTKRFHIHFAISTALGISGNDEGGMITNFETGLFYKIWKIELGIEPAFTFFNEDRGVLTTSLLIIKIPINRW